MMSLTSKDETIQRLSRTAEDKEKTLRAQLVDLQGKSKHRLGDLGSQVEQLQAEVARRMLESERLAESLSAVTKANDENKVRYVVDRRGPPHCLVKIRMNVRYRRAWRRHECSWRQKGPRTR
jgi:hypothetical protein